MKSKEKSECQQVLTSLLCTLYCLFAAAGAGAQDYRIELGFTRLQSELGPSVPSGTNIAVSHIEGVQTNGAYMPDTNNVEFAGKTFYNRSLETALPSSHATEVGRYLYGLQTGMASNIVSVSVFEAGDWITNGFLNAESPVLAPEIETNAIQNCSWITDEFGFNTNILRRLDYAIVRDGFTSVVAVNNGSNNPTPPLLCNSYNAISVGLVNGTHSRGPTTIDGPGRTKPEIVAPQTFVSFAVPQVSASAALLMETARANGWTNALFPESVKALLLAGASKANFPGWSHTSLQPLDSVYGAGELNIYNSYQILVHGQHTASSSNEVPVIGWHTGTISPGSPERYFFSVPSNSVLADVSAMLAWNRVITNASLVAFDPVPFLANLDLKLYSATGFSLGPAVDVSTSLLSNVEHVYEPRLDPGQYAFEVSSDSTSRYALAWFGKVMSIPVITNLAPTGVSFQVVADVTTGFSYVTEATTNLANMNSWAPIDTNLVLAAPYSFIDSGASNVSQRYYRVVPER